MRLVCAALNCRYSSESEDSSNVSFINFPNDDTAKVWAEFCGRSDLVAKSNAELHSNYYVCSHHIEDHCYVSKIVPVVLEEGTVPTLFRTDLTTDGESSINMFDKEQHLHQVDDGVPRTYCDMSVNELDEYHNISVRFSNLCRICGKSTLDGIDVFAAEGIALKLKERINLHLPISIDIDDSLPQKVCTDCCNKLEVVHSLVVSCLRTDMRLKRILNVEREPEYETKYNALIDELEISSLGISSLEIIQEMYMNHNTHSNSFTINKMINSDSEISLRGLGNGESSEIQNNHFQNMAKSIVPLELGTLIQTCRQINCKSNLTVTEEISKVQDKTQNGSPDVLCQQCQTFCETQEIFENHKIFCSKQQNVSKHDMSITTESGRSITCNERFQVIDNVKSCESVHCTVCNQSFKCQQDYDNHKCLHTNLEVDKRCGHCEKVYRNRKDLLIHIMESHGGRLSFKCSTCDKTYEKWSSLDIHEATHRTDKPYLCDLCGKSFKHSNNLRGHKRTHLDESIKKRHVCEICGNAFRSRFHLREHMNHHDGNRPYSCEQCGKAFYRRIQLRQHKLSHGFNRHTCPICGATFNRRGNMNTHMKRHNNDSGGYTCSVCAYRCKTMSELKIHRKKHTEEEIADSIKKKCNDKEIWRCDICSKIFPRRAVLLIHQRVHGDDKLYECDECGKKLASKSSLTYHKRSMHLRERPHMCHYCGDSFVSKEARLIHERIHTGERPYSCKVCNMRYRCSSNLSQHMKIHAGLKPHKCHFCNKGFTRKGALTVHERIHTGVKPFPCETCGKSFSQKNDMLKHAKRATADRCGAAGLTRSLNEKNTSKRTAVHEQDNLAISNINLSHSSSLCQY
ncbi:PREDICTED: zinc finger protein 271-like [Vollenhovia emeryi]|uniref:zinc finger protein 271-like n=1 Tax=Vollenhovia emeryi TaxID=411798 RepID=UPI0005F371C9|nr:PREDICTED: zinc finger protein 271-like [Vollenhovia emeryi]XP_011881527.1 PREDICTED: zinc finger protein 271-like [Vollenhovia emeryi]XP_011881528.1 PREDICTED: zinc finger protein 271-like [Vollenhovia emeryi]XP_011881529.1 PREDICTED: zinc finger protein 271-like [Vollenhovia emeryi]